MKVFAVALLLACGQLALVLAHQEVVKKCLEETNSSVEDLMRFADGGDATDNSKCFYKCMMLANGGMTNDGKLVLEPMLPHFPPEKQNIAQECVKIDQGGELCDLAWRHHVCIRKMDPAFYKEMFSKKKDE